MSRIPVGIQLYTVREQMAEDPVATIEAVAKMGYEGAEGGPPQGMANSEFVRVLADNGLKLMGGDCNPKELREDIAAVVDRSGELGIDTMMTGIGGELQETDGDWKRVVAELAEGCAQAAEAGLRVCYHNHAFEFEQKVDEEYGLDYLLSTIPESDIKAELDVYWIKTGGEDPVKYINKYASRLPRLHLKDRAPSPADEECPFAEVGQGILDWDGIFAAAPNAGVEWYFVEQDLWTRPPLESARMSLDFLKGRGMV